MADAVQLRDRFRELPKDQIQAHQDFAIRVWSGMSWLERAEAMDTYEYEGRFISLWIALNALYGRVTKEGVFWGDREAAGAFLATVSRTGDQELI